MQIDVDEIKKDKKDVGIRHKHIILPVLSCFQSLLALKTVLVFPGVFQIMGALSLFLDDLRSFNKRKCVHAIMTLSLWKAVGIPTSRCIPMN